VPSIAVVAMRRPSFPGECQPSHQTWAGEQASASGGKGADRRDGAFDWGICEDASKERVCVETFCVDSWLDHMRRTNA
jgi:hypothetical protein